jgi:hypothetical protein
MAAVQGGEGWQCPRCAQRWDAERLAAVGRYAAWVASHKVNRSLLAALPGEPSM